MEDDRLVIAHPHETMNGVTILAPSRERAALERVKNILDRATVITSSHGHGPGSRVDLVGWRIEESDMRRLYDALGVLHG